MSDEAIKTNARIFAALLFFLLVFRLPARLGEGRESFWLIFEICITLSLAALLWRHNKYVALFLIWSFISMLYPRYNDNSFMAQRLVFFGCFWYFLVVTSFTVDTVGYLFDVMCAGALLCLWVQLLQVIFQNFGIAISSAWTGLMTNLNETGSLYVFVIPAFLLTKRYLGAALMLAGIYWAASEAGAAGVYAGVLILIACQVPKRDWATVGLMVGLAFMVGYLVYSVIAHPGGSLGVRLTAWKITYPPIKQYGGFWGLGIGHWKSFFLNPLPVLNSRWDMAHNDPYQVWAEMGIPGISLVALYLADILRKFKSELILTYLAVGMITVISLGLYPWKIAPTAIIAVTWAGILQVQLREKWVQVPNYPIFIREGGS